MQAWELAATTNVDRLFDWCAHARAVDRLLLSARLDQDCKEPVLLNPSVDEIVASLFGERLLERRLARRWPGTELVGHNGVVYVIDFDASLIGSMVEVGPRLADWRHSRPDSTIRLPEDPCLYKKGDNWPTLISVTHEGDAWIISESRPPFCADEAFEFAPENLLVPTAVEGFLGD